MASAWNPVAISPDAIMPVTKYWVYLTPPPMSAEKIEPKITIMITGKPAVNTTCCLLRQNCLISLPIWRRHRLTNPGVGSGLSTVLVAGAVVVVMWSCPG
jgi:hypothetical protein